MLSVRRAGPADVEAWTRLRVALMLSERLVEPGAAAAALTPAIAAWLRERLDSPAFGAFLAELDGRVVGSGGISIYDAPPGPGPSSREAYIMSMYTEPDWRGRGVARAVLTTLLDFAQAAGGVGRVWLRASAMGRPLYLAAGFEPRDSYLQLRLDR
ncbi:MAG TPA: GNAT family N-acetyltransferase [Candidatus Eisenbacteria bacterium]|nr:GNAT family N-acetyltransferase [Candidatus Eisenbacteria bacterium]